MDSEKFGVNKFFCFRSLLFLRVVSNRTILNQVRWGDAHDGYGEHYWEYNHGPSAYKEPVHHNTYVAASDQVETVETAPESYRAAQDYTKLVSKFFKKILIQKKNCKPLYNQTLKKIVTVVN